MSLIKNDKMKFKSMNDTTESMPNSKTNNEYNDYFVSKITQNNDTSLSNPNQNNYINEEAELI